MAMSQHPSPNCRPDRIPLSAIQVRWSDTAGAFVAWSDRCPGLTHADPWSSLAALDGLIERGAEHTVMVVADRIYDDDGEPVGTAGFYIDLSSTLAEAERDLVSQRLPEMVEARAVIEQAKGVLMRMYRINAEQAFKVLIWRSQETNTKLRALATQLLIDLVDVPPTPAATIAAFDHILLTAHERIPH
ncbi:ANTAR domain-containing protein [Nocardia sp. NPDC020380]|uniref:ANTAR domain-containing protein n=1 Tax=Nocardia sp. NPDC020380 TaxID=3364309 RepID=UPI0037B18380